MAAEARERETRPNGRVWTQPHRRHRGAIGIGHVGLILGVVALALGGSGLAIALTHAGPAGATGATGSTGATGKNGVNGTNGAPGPGAVINGTSEEFGGPVNNTTCVDEPGADVGLKASGPGTVIVTATVTIQFFHIMGNTGDVVLSLVSCSFMPQYAYVANAEPSDDYYVSVSLVLAVAVSTAGTYTYSLFGENDGFDPANYFTITVVGVYYPS